MNPLQLREDDIGRRLAEAERTGELRAAPSDGRPLAGRDGFDETPLEWRLPFKILKDAGIAPPEVALFHARAALRDRIAAATTAEARRDAELALAALEPQIALRREAMRRG